MNFFLVKKGGYCYHLVHVKLRTLVSYSTIPTCFKVFLMYWVLCHCRWDCGMFMLKYIDFYSRNMDLIFGQVVSRFPHQWMSRICKSWNKIGYYMIEYLKCYLKLFFCRSTCGTSARGQQRKFWIWGLNKSWRSLRPGSDIYGWLWHRKGIVLNPRISTVVWFFSGTMQWSSSTAAGWRAR